jgi:class 3 adenylate cyclase
MTATQQNLLEKNDNPTATSRTASTRSAARKGGLPARWARNRLVAALATLLVVASVAWLLRGIGGADALGGWWLRARFAIREKVQPATPDPDIVLVTLDDRSVDKWPEPLAAWGGHMANAINRVQAGGARLVALDWMQPEPTSAFFNDKFKQNDERLGQALNRMGNVVLVKGRRAGANGDEWLTTTPEILYALPDAYNDPAQYLGYAELVGEENIVATLVPGVHADAKRQTLELSFPARIVQRYLQEPAELADGHWSVQGKVDVPLREDGALLINYRNGSGGRAFREYSLVEIAQSAKTPDTRFKDKIVIFGATWRGFNDDHYIPVLNGWTRARKIPGVEVNAHAVRTLLDARPILEPGANSIWLLAMTLSLVGLAAFSSLRWAVAALVSVGAAVAWMAFSLALFVYADYALPIVVPLISLLLTGALMGGYRALGEERERAQVLKVWGRFQDPRMVSHLLANPELRSGQGRECEVTVLFADLKNFTKTVESLQPGDALHQLNRYLSLMTEVIRDEYGGVIDKYLGDGLMAQWGAPELWESDGAQGDGHATCAVRACLELERRIRELSLSSGGSGDVTFGLRLTLHTGPVVAGCVGHEQRIEYTIIGDTVNVTSRLQETAKELGCEFLISESTYDYVSDWVATGQQTEVAIRGRKQPLRVYEIVGERDGKPRECEAALSA